MGLDNLVDVSLQLADCSMETFWKTIANHYQPWYFTKKLGQHPSAPVLEIACCMVAKHGQHPAKQYLVQHLLTLVWFAGSVVSGLNNVLELNNSMKSLV